MKNSILSSKIRQLYDNCENYFDSFYYLIKHIIILDIILTILMICISEMQFRLRFETCISPNNYFEKKNNAIFDIVVFQ